MEVVLYSIDIQDKKGFIKMINDQIKIISDAGYCPNQFFKNKSFVKQAKWIDAFIKKYKSEKWLKDIEIISYKSIKPRWQIKKWLIYIFGSLFIINGMWNSYFFRSTLKSEWKSNFFLDTVSTITTWLTLFFFISFVLIRVCAFFQFKKSEKSKIDAPIEYKYFLIDLIDHLNNTSEKTVQYALKKI